MSAVGVNYSWGMDFSQEGAVVFRLESADYRTSASERTKCKIAQAFESVLKVKPFEKIIVSDITSKCGISRQTFYNHFLDKYDLVNWIYQQLLHATTRRIGIDLTWEQAVRSKLEIMKNNAEFFSEIFSVTHSEGLLNTEAELVFDYYQDNLMRLVGKKLNELETYSLKIYCYGATRMTAEWICSGATMPIEMIIVANKVALPPFAQKIFLA